MPARDLFARALRRKGKAFEEDVLPAAAVDVALAVVKIHPLFVEDGKDPVLAAEGIRLSSFLHGEHHRAGKAFFRRNDAEGGIAFHRRFHLFELQKGRAPADVSVVELALKEHRFRLPLRGTDEKMHLDVRHGEDGVERRRHNGDEERHGDAREDEYLFLHSYLLAVRLRRARARSLPRAF